MHRRFPLIAACLTASLCTLATPWRDAMACGGGAFYDTEDQTISGAVGGHKVVISLSTKQTVLWDQIVYKGAPQDFAWVMPVPAGSSIDVASNAWIEALDATTAVDVSSRGLDCGGDDSDDSAGCACFPVLGDAAPNLGPIPDSGPPVTLVHQGSVGPYETVTIKSDTPGAVAKWLTDNGYKIPAAVQPILDGFAAKGMDFIALRLKPNATVHQMQPVRVTMPGSITTFPMRMLSAGAAATVALDVFVISEGRVEVAGFPHAEIDPSKLTWDFATHTSNYGDVRAEALSASGGKAWLTTYAKQGTFLSPINGQGYKVKDEYVRTIAEAYYLQGVADGETSSSCPLDPALADSTAEVVDSCASAPMHCADPAAGELDARAFDCGALSDLGVVLTGHHPKDVWLSRFEAELPVAALNADLSFTPAMTADEVDNHVTASGSKNVAAGCKVDAAAALVPGDATPPKPPAPRPRLPRGRTAMAAAVVGLAAAISRRMRRLRPVSPVRV